MDAENIIKKLATEKGLFITDKDPLFAAIILNRMILEEYTNEIELKIAEGITNIAIKEDSTEKKLSKIMHDQQIKFKEELDRVLTRFKEEALTMQNHPKNLPGKTDNHKIFISLMITFAVGLIIGGAIMRILL